MGKKTKNKTLLLIKTMLIQDLRLNNLTNADETERTKNILLAFLIFISVVSVIISIGSLYWLIAGALVTIGRLDGILTMSYIGATVTSLIFSIYKSPGSLYSFKDFDLLMSLPVKERDVLVSKIFMLYASNAATAFLFAAPAIVVYGMYTSVGFLFYAAGFLMILLTPVIPVVVGAVASILITRAAVRFKWVNVLVIIITFVSLYGFIALTMSLQNVSSDEMSGAFLATDKMLSYYYPGQLYAEALSGGILQFILYVSINIIIFTLFAFLFAKMFKTVNLLMGEKSAVKYKPTAMSVSTPVWALYIKELRHYFSIPSYVINTSVGIVLMTIYVVSLVVSDYETIATMLEIPSAIQYASSVSCALICLCVTMTCTTAPSISLESNTLWILKTIPMRFQEIALCKILLNLTITVPFVLLDSLLLTFAFSLPVSGFLLLLIPALAYALFTAVLGLVMNLFYPKLNWKTPTNAVKQSASVFITMMIGYAVVFAPIAVYIIAQPESYTFFILTTVSIILLAAYMLWHFLRTRGTKIFNSLSN